MTDNRPIVPCRRTDDRRLVIFDCDHCDVEHVHGAHISAPGCAATVWNDATCSCPTGSGDGHRVAHCHDPASPYDRTGYVLREVAR